MKKHLTRFESLARRLIEGSFGRMFGDQLDAAEVAGQVARALTEGQEQGLAPDDYQVTLNPADFNQLQQQTPELTERLSEYIVQLATQANLQLSAPPSIHVTAAATVPVRRVQVRATHSANVEQSTQLYAVHSSAGARESGSLAQLDAFLILDGKRHVPVTKSITNLGRRMDNDIVLDSAAVSRRHAQLRWRYGRFILYDLSGRGRTFVNGEPVTECALQPGDVIGLSDVLIVYGEGQSAQGTLPERDDRSDTQLLPPQ